MSKITLEEWNAEITQNLIPNIVILSLCLIIGVFGNLIVIAVYTFQMKEKITSVILYQFCQFVI